MAKGQYIWRNGVPRPFYTASAGIYAIVNRNNCKMYVGSARNLAHRWGEHRSALQQNKHHSRYLQRAFNNDPEAFYVEVIEELDNPTKEALLGREQFWLDFYRPFDPVNGYNVCPKAESCQGIKRAPEFLAKVSAALKGKKFSAARLEIHRNRKRPTKFRSFTPEQRAAQSKKRTGTKVSAETRAKMSKALKTKPPHQRAVLQFDLKGNFIARYPMVIRAEEAISGTRLGIANACEGKTTHAGGFQWRYADQIDNPEGGIKSKPQRRYRNVRLIQETMAGTLVRIHRSFGDAEVATYISEGAIRAAMKRGKPCGGFNWRRADG